MSYDDCELLPGGIPHVKFGYPASPLTVLSGGQAFMRRPGPERLRRDAARLTRLIPKGLGFTLFGYGPRHYVDAGLDSLADSFAAILGCRSHPVQLIGVSYGGLVATRLAARHPDLVSDLILVASAASFSEEGRAHLRRQIDLTEQRRYAELVSAFGGSFRRPWYNWLLSVRLHLRRAQLADEMNTPDEILAYLRAGQAIHETHTCDSLSRITVRTLLVGGSNDQFFGQQIANTAQAINRARLHLLPNETHMAPIERSRDIRRVISAFLAESENQVAEPARTTWNREQPQTRKGNADV